MGERALAPQSQAGVQVAAMRFVCGAGARRQLAQRQIPKARADLVPCCAPKRATAKSVALIHSGARQRSHNQAARPM